jgi:hypothetical protein
MPAMGLEKAIYATAFDGPIAPFYNQILKAFDNDLNEWKNVLHLSHKI